MTTRPRSPLSPLDPEVEGLLIDRARGELTPPDAARLEALLRDRPELEAQAAQELLPLLAAARAAFEETPEPGQAERIVARVRARTEAESVRERRGALTRGGSRRLLWPRLLAVSVGLHVVLLGVLVLKSRQAEREDRPVRISVELPAPGILEESESYEPASASPWLPAPGELDLPEARLAAADLPGPGGSEPHLRPLAQDRHAYPPLVSGPMQVRRRDALKRGRLQLLGFDADGTLKAVGRGLKALESRQTADGSFPAGGGRSGLGQTALALLPFLGEGHGSRTESPMSQRVVAPGVAWVRQSLFGSDAPDASASVADLGIALKALSEDFMLSYGRLRPVEAQRRAQELTRLTERIVAAQDDAGLFPGADEDMRLAAWPMWGLEAAARTGTVLPPATVAERFRTWYGSRPRTRTDEVAAGLLLARTLGASFGREAADVATRRALMDGFESQDDAFVLAATGTGLLLHDARAFKTWSRGLDEKLIRSLLQTGVAREGDPVGDTATLLLALQVAYRTY